MSGKEKSKAPFIISCGIFKEELEYLAGKKFIESDILFLDPALHVNFDRLKQRLIQALEENKKRGAGIAVFYGNCHPEMRKIMELYGAKKIDAINCIEAIVGREELRRLDAEAKTFFLTVGWINNWQSIFHAGKTDLNLDFSKLFEDYQRIVVFDSGVIPVDEAKVRQFSKFTGLPVERRQVSLQRLKRLLP